MTTSLLRSKIISLTEARRLIRDQEEDGMSGSAEDRRRDFRYESNERMFVQIVACNDSELVGTTVSCQAIDVSAGGLRIETGSEIPDGCRLDIWVDIASRPGKFFLTSNVRWSRMTDDGVCLLGVELHEGPTTDIEEWRRAYC